MDYVYLKIQVANIYCNLQKYLARKRYCSDVKQVTNQLKDVVTRAGCHVVFYSHTRGRCDLILLLNIKSNILLVHC